MNVILDSDGRPFYTIPSKAVVFVLSGKPKNHADHEALQKWTKYWLSKLILHWVTKALGKRAESTYIRFAQITRFAFFEHKKTDGQNIAQAGLNEEQYTNAIHSKDYILCVGCLEYDYTKADDFSDMQYTLSAKLYGFINTRTCDVSKYKVKPSDHDELSATKAINGIPVIHDTLIFPIEKITLDAVQLLDWIENESPIPPELLILPTQELVEIDDEIAEISTVEQQQEIMEQEKTQEAVIYVFQSKPPSLADTREFFNKTQVNFSDMVIRHIDFMIQVYKVQERETRSNYRKRNQPPVLDYTTAQIDADMPSETYKMLVYTWDMVFAEWNVQDILNYYETITPQHEMFITQFLVTVFGIDAFLLYYFALFYKRMLQVRLENVETTSLYARYNLVKNKSIPDHAYANILKALLLVKNQNVENRWKQRVGAFSELYIKCLEMVQVSLL